jgi:hypothetical protein
MSTGAWIFTGLITAAVLAPVSVYAASITKTAIANSTGTTVASVTAQHQLLTANISPSAVVRLSGGSNTAGCKSFYTPPAHKAIVVTSVVYTFGSGTDGVEHFGGLGQANCGQIYDQIDTVQAFDTIQHTYPSGLPLPNIGISNGSNKLINVFIVGYLIDSSALPPAQLPARASGHVKASSTGR